jgi:ubiquinone/menaquinone biosynthesis C-methylase UbiE
MLERVKEHPIFARCYERLSTMLNDAGEVDNRIELVGPAEGRVLEVGCGNGLNFEHYRRAETVVALEPQPAMMDLARPRAAEASVEVTLVRGIAEALPFPDDCFDTVVTSLVLCSVQDPDGATREIARVLRPGGELRYLEHIRSSGAAGAAVQDLIAPVWAFFAGNCHPNRDTPATLERAGFEATGRRFPFGPPSPCRPHVLGLARLRDRPTAR